MRQSLLFSMLGAMAILNSPHCLAQPLSKVLVIKDTKHDVSMNLQDAPLGSFRKISFHPVLERLATGQVTITAFQGLGQSLGSYVIKSTAPNVSGGVGLTQYVQWVDPDLAVFDKKTGQIAPGFPKPGNAIWAGFGGPCETENSEIPQVIYDQLAHRWVLTRQAFANPTTGPFFQCVAVSQTDDATGAYYRYAFEMNSRNNFGKIGLWSDAYYLGMNMFGPVDFGPRVCALDRNKMLMGLPASAECFQLKTTHSGPLLPADLGGTAFPVAGMPGFFFGLKPPQNLLMFKLHADFANPNNASLSTGISIPVLNFEAPCSSAGGGSCVIQPNTANKLDLFGDRFSSSVVYRQFGDHASLAATHNIQGPPPKLAPAIRWYELWILDSNNPNANPIVHQQQDFAPDTMNRFSGSLGVDKVGNIAMGYTVSSSAVYPSPEIAYRNYYDSLNNLTLQALFTGLASQTGVSDWSSYSSMALDPIDNCTFWYSNEYLKTAGSSNWDTMIAHFKLPSCT